MDSWLEAFAHTAFQRSSNTAHDLKTPLNIAVLNLELLRMRVRKVLSSDDEKVIEYARSIEMELRRLAQIFDAYFILVSPPKNEDAPELLDLGALCQTEAESTGYKIDGGAPFKVLGHESRIRQALRLFFEGASRILRPEGRIASLQQGDRFKVSVAGTPQAEDFEVTKIFKFYYTDSQGNPNLALASARLIAETYGGELNATEENGNVCIDLSFPAGEK